MARVALPAHDVQNRLSGLPGWALVDGALYRQFEFKDFVQAFSFMTAAALVAEAKNHHPDWRNVYRTVEVRLSTHDAGGITELDFELAGRLKPIVTIILNLTAGMILDNGKHRKMRGGVEEPETVASAR